MHAIKITWLLLPSAATVLHIATYGSQKEQLHSELAIYCTANGRYSVTRECDEPLIARVHEAQRALQLHRKRIA